MPTRLWITYMPIHVCQHTPRKNTFHILTELFFFRNIVYMIIWTSHRCAIPISSHTHRDTFFQLISANVRKQKISHFSTNHLCKHRIEAQHLCLQYEQKFNFQLHFFSNTNRKRYAIGIGSWFMLMSVWFLRKQTYDNLTFAWLRRVFTIQIIINRKSICIRKHIQ